MKNSEVNFIAAFGDEDKQASLSFVKGAAGVVYHLYVGGYAWARVGLHRPTGEWIVLIQTDEINNLLTSDDRQILIELASGNFEDGKNLYSIG